MGKPTDTTTTPTAPSVGTATTAEGIRIEQPAQFLDEYSPDVAMRMMRDYLAQQRDLKSMAGGRWILPSTHRHLESGFVFIRLGSRTDVARVHVIEMRRRQLIEQGWLDAPRGTRNSLFMGEGDHGVYMCIARPAWEAREEWERELRKKQSERRLGKQGSDLQALMGDARLPIGIESVDIQRGTSSVREFLASTSAPKK
jgi:hypothetical protein